MRPVWFRPAPVVSGDVDDADGWTTTVGAPGLTSSALRVVSAVTKAAALNFRALEIDPGWFLLAALTLMLVYRGALSGQIPLYLSNRQTAQTLAELLPQPRFDASGSPVSRKWLRTRRGRRRASSRRRRRVRPSFPGG